MDGHLISFPLFFATTKTVSQPGMEAHAFNPNPQEAEAEGS
jgi:hypothetical protein